MPDDALSEFINNDSSPRIEVKSIDGFSYASRSNRVIATSLVWLGGFDALLLEARHKLGIEPQLGIRHLIEIPIPVSSEIIATLPVPLEPEQLELLATKTDEIVGHFNLTGNWVSSIKLAILTNILYLPPELEPIQLMPSGSSSSYPAIQITAEVSINQLRQFIQKNANEIRRVVSRLPSSRETQVDEDTMMWGQAIGIAVKQVPMGNLDRAFALVNEKLDEVLNAEETDYSEGIFVPDERDLRRFYERFLNYSLRLQPNNILVLPDPPS